MVSNRLLVIVGNGLSISANSGFALKELTKRFRDQLKKLEKDDLSGVLTLQQAKTNLPLDLSEDFEELVGTMYARSLDLRHLKGVFARFYGSEDEKTGAIEYAEQITWNLSRDAVSALLQVVYDLTYSDETNVSTVDEFLRALKKKWTTNVDIFTLNYDSLLFDSMLRVYQSAGMFDLGTTSSKSLHIAEETVISAQNLRTASSDFLGLSNRSGLFHLHGSVNFWREGHSGPDFRVSKDSLRDSGILFRDVLNHDSFRPLVLLGMWDSKWYSVKQAPYSLAYEMLERRLSATSKILIVGTSLREPAVLELIGNAINAAGIEGRDFEILRVDPSEITRDKFIHEVEQQVKLTNGDFKYSSLISSIDNLDGHEKWLEFSEH